MNTPLHAGQRLDSGFEITEVRNLEELQATGIWARHIASGAEVFHILNDDSENLFAFAFKTPPEDSTGVAHILEHSVLCGSKNYPLKDAFIILAQGSLQTFLNAMTYPDKTVYPASSTNEHDYFNLMSVYGDAVFRPLLEEWTFLQEGHRLEFAPSEGGEKLSVTGVVYNEMKGAYSSLESFAGHWSIRGVLPDTIYAHDSGGDPEDIPDLTLEQLREFHRTRYAPSNCRIFLAGNIPTEKQLAFLNEKFLSDIPAGTAVPPIAKAKPWTEPQTIRVPCPAGSEQKSTVLLSWVCSDAADSAETLALAALTETLLGHDGSPLTKALTESRLGEDLAPASGLEGEIRETVFSAGLRGVQSEDAGKVSDLIMAELKKLAAEGIPKEEIEAALLSMEFSHKEIRRSGGPYSLVWLRRSLRGWLHGTAPWESLLFAPSFEKLKKNLAGDSRYFESLIEKYLLNNPHRALILVEPDEQYLERQEARQESRLTEKLASMTAEERAAVREKSAELEQIQTEGDSPEDLAAIPHLSRKELSTETEKVPREFHDAGGVPVLSHELFTNGITYMDFALPLDIFEPRDYPWFPFFSRASVSMGLPGMDYAKVSSLLALTAGGFYGMLQTGGLPPGTGRTMETPSGILDLGGRDWIVFRLKALDEKIEEAADLAYRLIMEADFTDTRRLEDLTAEMKNDVDSSLAPSGHLYAAGMAGRYFSRARGIDELWSGLAQLEFVHTLQTMDSRQTAEKLSAIRDTLVSRGGLIANITGSQAAIGKALAILEKKFSAFGSPRPRNTASEGIDPFLSLLGSLGGAQSAAPAVYASPSLQVGFAALALPGTRYASREQSAELVLSHMLSTGALWEDIRMRGGAYGAFAYPDRMEEVFLMATYRDPNPVRSLDSFKTILQNTADEIIEESELEKTVIGAYSKETRPRTSAEKGGTDFFRYLYGIEDIHIQRKLEAMADISGDEVRAAARRLAALTEKCAAAVLTGTGAAEKAAARLGASVWQLPV
ncbi:insulinase family protein [Breznakiella homolactica]|uniref:Insulinase family protein n=1 Tax=Breznakiella homolactica TaxID=2798577 RepID=A0A7T7XQ79_9SPIR|nr:insulinase family protein [Breznakiella homolactica]QQO10495.1 insulinase family protein [Breznakiella homolactica]